MEKGLVDLAKLRENRDDADYEGKSSYAFKIGDKFVKIYARKCDKGFFNPPNVNNLVDFSNFKAKTIVFPEEYIYENGKKAGEILQFVHGKTLDYAINDLVNIKLLIKSYESVLSDIHTYSCIEMVDLCYVNILYSNRNGFHIIDTTDWVLTDNAIYENLYSFNSSIINTLVGYLKIPFCVNRGCYKIDNSFLESLYKYGNEGKRLEEALVMLDDDQYNLFKLLYAYQGVYKIHYSMEAKTLEDVKELTKVLKKG